MIPTLEKILMQIVEDVGIEVVTAFLLAGTSEDKRKAILDAQYAAMEAALDAQQRAAAKEP